MEAEGKMTVREDAALVRMCLNGDRQAFGELVDRYENLVYGFVLNRIGDFDQAEDLAQDVFIEAYIHLGTLRTYGGFASWLCGIAQNLCSRWLTRRQRESEILEQLPAFEEERGRILMFRDTTGPRTPEEEVSSSETREAIWCAVGELPERSREVVLLFYFNDMSHTEIGKFLGVAPSTVLWHLHNGREKLRKKMMPLVEETIRGKRLRGRLAKKVLAALPLISFPKPKPLLPFVKWGLSLRAVLGVIGTLAVVGGLIGWRMFEAGRPQSSEVHSRMAVRLATSRETAGLRQQLNEARDEAGQSLIHQPGGGRIIGAMQDVRGQPVPDTHVQIAGVTLPNGLFVYLRDGPEFPVDEDGTYELGELRDGEYLLRFWSDALGCRGQMEGVSPGREPARVTLGLTGSISGRVTDEEGRSIAGAEVSTRISPHNSPSDGAYSDSYRGVTDDEGRYLLKGLPYEFSDPYDVPSQISMPQQRVWATACAAGYVTLQKGVRLGYGGWRKDVDLVLESGGVSISGAVRDRFGVPISGARIFVTGSGCWTDAVSGGQGRFVIDGLRSGTFRMVVSAEGFASNELSDVAGGTDDLVIALSHGGTISGRVTEPVEGTYGNHPVQGVMVQARHRLAQGMGAGALTDASGIYRISALAEGPYRVTVLSSSSPSIRGRLVSFEEKDVEVKEGQTIAGVDFRLRRGISVSGRLTYADTGEPVGEVKVVLQGSNWMETVTDEEGRYRFEGVAPGKYYLQIDVGGYAEVPYRREVSVEGIPEGMEITGMDIQLVRRASLHVRVTDTDGRPIADAEVRYVMPDQRTDENGECRYEEVRPEWPCHLMVDHPEYAFAIVDSVILAPGEDRRMTFVLSSGSMLEGTIRDWRGEPVPDAQILVCSVAPGCPWYWSRRFGRIVHADENGYYRAVRVPQGSIRLVVDHKDPLFAPLETIVQIDGDGSVTRRDLSVSSGGTVTDRNWGDRW